MSTSAKRSWGLAVALTVALAGTALAAGGVTPATTSPTAPPSGSTNLSGAVKLFGDPGNGSKVFAANCAVCHGAGGQATATWTNATASPTTQGYPGLADVQNSNSSFAIDPTIFDVNPAIFAQNLDAFIQNGSRPNFNNTGATASEQANPTMPDWGFANQLTTQQMADVEAYIMSLSQVKWPTLSASVAGGKLSVQGSNFLAGSQVSLNLGSTALGTATVSGTAYATNGQLPYGTFQATFSLPSGTTSGTVQADYATVNVKGIFPGGDPANMSGLSPAAEGGSDGLGMDGSAGAKLPVASANFTVPATAPASPPAAITPAPVATPPIVASPVPPPPSGNGAGSVNATATRSPDLLAATA